MFAARSKTAPMDELLMVVQLPSSQPVSPVSGEAPMPSTNKDFDHAHHPELGFRDLVDHHFTPDEDDKPSTYCSQGGKLSLSQLFNFRNGHWVKLHEEQVNWGYNEELALYDLLNEDAAIDGGVEVDVDEATATILVD